MLEVKLSYLFSKLDVAETNRNWPVAIGLGERILALLPNHEEARARTGAAYLKKCQQYAAKKDKTIRRRSDPYDEVLPSLPQISSSRLLYVQYPEFRNDLEQAITLDPSNAEGYYWLSALCYGKQQIEMLTRAIENDRCNNGKYYYRRSLVREREHLQGVKSTEMSSLHEGKIRSPDLELQAQARQRGRQRVNDAAQHDFDRALKLGFEEAIAEKNYKEPDFSFLSAPSFGSNFLNEILKPKK